MNPYTYRDLIRKYADDVLRGRADVLPPRQRRYLGIMLNVASNAPRAVVLYPPTDATRDDVREYLLGAALAEMRAILTNAEDADFGAAVHRALDVVATI